jgi:hypothetical protein
MLILPCVDCEWINKVKHYRNCKYYTDCCQDIAMGDGLRHFEKKE